MAIGEENSQRLTRNRDSVTRWNRRDCCWCCCRRSSLGRHVQSYKRHFVNYNSLVQQLEEEDKKDRMVAEGFAAVEQRCRQRGH